MQVYFKKLKSNAILPKRATPFSAGADLFACLDKPVVVKPNETVMIPLGIASQTSKQDITMLVFARSGLASKFGITLANAVGVVDSDYRGEWIVPLHNISKQDFIVEHGMRIAQMVITPVIFPEILEVNQLDETERGNSGFGSSGLQ
ncbi:MAG: dUTP diphosphatase [Oscillospiraceae bacterium]|nr:dUTP diphosphatase [Oscillospiraceae bacterium]MDE6657261.1 dUTP diphosphatase [Oscillospiraceae bacterium]